MTMAVPQDPMNPATFSQVHAELERPLLPGGGLQGPIGYDDPYHPSQPQHSSGGGGRQHGGIPEYTSIFTHSTHRSTQEA